ARAGPPGGGGAAGLGGLARAQRDQGVAHGHAQHGHGVGYGQHGAALADRAAGAGRGTDRPHHGRPAELGNQGEGVRAAQVARPDSAGADAGPAAVAAGRRPPGRTRRHAALAETDCDDHPLAAVLRAVCHSAVGLAVQLRQQLPAALVRPVPGAGAQRPRPGTQGHCPRYPRDAVLGDRRVGAAARRRGALAPPGAARRNPGPHAAGAAAAGEAGPASGGTAMTAHTIPMLLLLALAGVADASDWTVQAGASALRFTGSMQGERFEGGFDRFQAEIRFDPADLAGARFEVTVDLASADTDNEERDETLLGPDFFNVERSPQAHYSASRF